MPEQNKVTFETQITSDEDMLSNTQTKLGYTTERMTLREISSRGDQGDEAGAQIPLLAVARAVGVLPRPRGKLQRWPWQTQRQQER